MDKKFLDSMNKKLLGQREILIESLAAQSNDMRSLVKTSDSGDVADIASDAIDRALLDSMGAQDAERLRQIDDALDKIREGKYGICMRCNREIPQARLKALPFAIMCVSCTEAMERSSR